MIGTEYGICAIQASKLNEALAEAITEDCATDEDNGWERVGERITNEEFEARTQAYINQLIDSDIANAYNPNDIEIEFK